MDNLRAPSLGEANAPSLSSHQLPVVLCLEVGPSDIFPFSVSMSLDMAIVPVLFVQPLLRESVSQ